MVTKSTSDEVKLKPYTRPQNTGIRFSNGHIVQERAPKEETAAMVATKRLLAETAGAAGSSNRQQQQEGTQAAAWWSDTA